MNPKVLNDNLKYVILSIVLPILMLITLTSIFRNPMTVQARNSLKTDEKIGNDVIETLRSGANARVVIALVSPDSATRPSPNLNEIIDEISVLQDVVLSSLSLSDFSLSHKYQAIPALAGAINTESGLYKLAANPLVAKIDLDVGGSGSLGVSVPLIEADTWHNVGNIGNGVVVAVLDSGLDTDHSDLADGLIHQECFLDADGNIDGVGLCPNGSDRQSGPGAAEDDAGHGTHVTGIIASRGNIGFVGVAPGVDIVSIKVTTGPSFSGTFYYFSEVVAALDYIINYRPDVQIINMSLVTYAQFAGDCDNSTSWNMAGATAINTLRSRGVVAFASSGNNGSSTLMSSPACLSNVISVGATDSSDTIASFTDSNSSTDILAPGVGIVSSAMGNNTTTASGTSMASPHAAGCAALFMAAGIAMTPDQIEARLETSPVQVYNPKNGLTFPRIDCTFEPVPLVSVDISGPSSGFIGNNYTFVATISPITATQPITYVWQATEQSPVTFTGNLTNSISYTWEISGTKGITITAQNIGSEVVDTHVIYIGEANFKIYLPILSK